jgi:hypothetical protein
MTVAINHSDPGAVPGASTKAHQLGMISAQTPSAFVAIKPVPTFPDHAGGLRRGRNRIDEGVKGAFFLGMVPPISGHAIVANDNYAPVAQAA